MAILQENQSQNRFSRRPQEKQQLTPTLAVSLWKSEPSEDGRVRFHWDVARIADDGSRTLATKTPESLLELPMFVARLAEAFASSSAIGEALRTKLSELAARLHPIAQALNADASRANGGNGKSLFTTAA